MSLQTVEPSAFGFVPARSIVVEVCAQQISGDAGLLAFRRLDDRRRFTRRLAAHGPTPLTLDRDSPPRRPRVR